MSDTPQLVVRFEKFELPEARQGMSDTLQFVVELANTQANRN